MNPNDITQEYKDKGKLLVEEYKQKLALLSNEWINIVKTSLDNFHQRMVSLCNSISKIMDIPTMKESKDILPVKKSIQSILLERIQGKSKETDKKKINFTSVTCSIKAITVNGINDIQLASVEFSEIEEDPYFESIVLYRNQMIQLFQETVSKRVNDVERWKEDWIKEQIEWKTHWEKSVLKMKELL
jgi:hypothetical protein